MRWRRPSRAMPIGSSPANLRDFPQVLCEPYGVEAEHPNASCSACGTASRASSSCEVIRIMRVIREQVADTGPAWTTPEPRGSARLRGQWWPVLAPVGSLTSSGNTSTRTGESGVGAHGFYRNGDDRLMRVVYIQKGLDDLVIL
jgi:hypothetical protein